MENLEIYNKFREVPKEAQKTIEAGKLKGMTDINPMWRIKMLTEQFGPCGRGWYIDIVDRWVENVNGQICVQVRINLFVKYDSEWSKPIEGIGGSMLYGKGVGSDTISDEAYKMAYTDAISVACKALGMAANIYYAKDRTKYNTIQPQEPQPQRKFNPEPVATPPLEASNIDGLFPKGDMPEAEIEANIAETIDDLNIRINNCKDLTTLKQIWEDAQKLLEGRPEFNDVKKRVAILGKKLS